MTNISEIGKVIREERIANNYSLETLAEKANITRQTLAKWEKGTGSPTVDDLLRLCEVFNCDLGYLVGEYPCRRRVYSDIQAETGLSELSIEKMTEINKKRSTVIGSAKMMILNAILTDNKFLDEAASLLYDYAMIPDDAFVNVEFLDKKRDLALISSLKSSDSSDIKRLYMAQLQNVIFTFLNEQFKK